MAEDRWGAKEIAGLLAMIAVVGAGFFVYHRLIEPKIDRAVALIQTGRPVASVITGDVVVLLDRVVIVNTERDGITNQAVDREEPKTRAIVVDAATGAKRFTTIIEAVGTCEAASPGRMWCDFGKLALYDARTVSEVITVEGAIARAAVGRPVPSRWRVDGARATQLLDDGRVAVLDATTLLVTREEKVPPSLRPLPLGMKPSPSTLTPAASSICTSFDASDFLSSKNKPAWRLERGEGERARVRNGKRASTDTFLRPRVVGSDDPPLLFHHTSLDPARDSLQLSRLTPSATLAWTVDVRRPNCENAGAVGALFVITTDSPQRRALGIDPSAGAVRWELSTK